MSENESAGKGAEKRIRTAFFVSRFIAISFMFSVVIVTGIAWFLSKQAGVVGLEESEVQGALLPLSLLAFVMLVLGHFMSEYFLKSAKERSEKEGEGVTQILGLFQLSVLSGNICREVAAITGFVLTFLTRDFLWAAAFGASSLLLMYLRFPSEADVKGFFPKADI